MGIIDSLTFGFTCPTCGAKEGSKVTQYGSRFGGSWGSPSDVKLFDVSWGQRHGQPSPTSAKCRKCAVEALID